MKMKKKNMYWIIHEMLLEFGNIEIIVDYKI